VEAFGVNDFRINEIGCGSGLSGQILTGDQKPTACQ
jgi:hypothetical protein